PCSNTSGTLLKYPTADWKRSRRIRSRSSPAGSGPRPCSHRVSRREFLQKRLHLRRLQQAVDAVAGGLTAQEKLVHEFLPILRRRRRKISLERRVQVFVLGKTAAAADACDIQRLVAQQLPRLVDPEQGQVLPKAESAHRLESMG